jgi:hypothetical protein
MDNKDFLMYRIMKGRLSFCRDGLFLYIKEPNPDTMYESIAIYQEFYDKAYGAGTFLKEEIPQVLIEKDLYSPFDDQDIEKYKKDIEELKYQCYKNFHRVKELQSLKYLIKKTEDAINKIYRKKNQLDHVTCEGVASLAQWNWIIERSTYYVETDRSYDWQSISLSTVMGIYEDSVILNEDFRAIARSNGWRPIWNLGKKTGDLFSNPSSMLTRDQIMLASFSSMYDSVYESPESPPDKVIEDDDCLDGWFIDQRKKNEKYKREQEAENIITNKKIANSSEIFIVAQSPEEIGYVDSLNSVQSRQIKKGRMEQMMDKGTIKDIEFNDVLLDLQMQQNNSIINKAKGN